MDALHPGAPASTTRPGAGRPRRRPPLGTRPEPANFGLTATDFDRIGRALKAGTEKRTLMNVEQLNEDDAYEISTVIRMAQYLTSRTYHN